MSEVKEIKVKEEELKTPIGIIEKDNLAIPYVTSDVKLKLFYETKHDEPCPAGYGTGVAQDRKINEYIFNHLPLTEDEKKKLLHDLKKDQIRKEREEESIQAEKEEIHKKRVERRKKRQQGLPGRVGVKETQNSVISNDAV